MALFAGKFEAEKMSSDTNRLFPTPDLQFKPPFSNKEQTMNRSQSYQKQAAIKLLSSQFVYPKAPSLQFIKKLVIATSIKGKNPEVGSTNITLLFGRRPSFSRTLRRQEKEYRLVNLTLTSHKQHLASDLDRLAHTILPFQLENRIPEARLLKGKETSWTLDTCTPATPMAPLLFPYPLPEEKFGLTLTLFHKNVPSSHISFYLTLFQLPLQIT
jgi:hypothetical protein